MLKLIHFANAGNIDPIKKTTEVAGSAHYFAPEMFSEEGANDLKKCDIWSAAVIMHLFLVGEPPYKGKKNDEIIEQMKAGEVKFESPEWKYVSNEGRDLCQ